MTIRRLLLPPAEIMLNGVIGLLLVVWAANGDWAQAGQPAGAEVGRRRIPLTDGWLVKQLDSEKPDVSALPNTRACGSVTATSALTWARRRTRSR